MLYKILYTYLVHGNESYGTVQSQRNMKEFSYVVLIPTYKGASQQASRPCLDFTPNSFLHKVMICPVINSQWVSNLQRDLAQQCVAGQAPQVGQQLGVLPTCLTECHSERLSQTCCTRLVDFNEHTQSRLYIIYELS